MKLNNMFQVTPRESSLSSYFTLMVNKKLKGHHRALKVFLQEGLTFQEPSEESLASVGDCAKLTHTQKDKIRLSLLPFHMFL